MATYEIPIYRDYFKKKILTISAPTIEEALDQAEGERSKIEWDDIYLNDTGDSEIYFEGVEEADAQDQIQHALQP